MKKLILFILVLVIFSLQAQNKYHRIDDRFGTSILGTGGMLVANLGHEVNYKLSRYFTGSFSFDYGESWQGLCLSSSLFAENINLYLSPLVNNGNNLIIEMHIYWVKEYCWG